MCVSAVLHAASCIVGLVLRQMSSSSDAHSDQSKPMHSSPNWKLEYTEFSVFSVVC